MFLIIQPHHLSLAYVGSYVWTSVSTMKSGQPDGRLGTVHGSCLPSATSSRAPPQCCNHPLPPGTRPEFFLPPSTDHRVFTTRSWVRLRKRQQCGRTDGTVLCHFHLIKRCCTCMPSFMACMSDDTQIVAESSVRLHSTWCLEGGHSVSTGPRSKPHAISQKDNYHLQKRK